MPTDLYTIYYNGHFTQMVYPDKLEEQLSKWGLPSEDIQIVQYPAGSIIPPFSVGLDKELYILKEEVPIEPPVTYSSSLKEILSTSTGKKFAERIRKNNEKLLDAGLEVVSIEPLSEEIEEPKFYSITATIQPVGVL